MGIEIPSLFGRYTWPYGITLYLECWADWGLADDFPCVWGTVGSANWGHMHLLLPRELLPYFTIFLDSVNLPKTTAPPGLDSFKSGTTRPEGDGR